MDSSRENVVEYDKGSKIIANHRIKDFDPVKSLPRIIYCRKCGKEVPREEIMKHNGKWYCKSCYRIVI